MVAAIFSCSAEAKGGGDSQVRGWTGLAGLEVGLLDAGRWVGHVYRLRVIAKGGFNGYMYETTQREESHGSSGSRATYIQRKQGQGWRAKKPNVSRVAAAIAYFMTNGLREFYASFATGVVPLSPSPV